MIKQKVITTKLHKVSDIAKAWDMSERSIRRAIASGKLGCFRIGRSVRVSDQQLNDYLESLGA